MPETSECRTLTIPSSREWLGIFNSALLEMTKAYNYEQVNDTDLTPEEVAAYCFDQYVSWLSSTCGGGVPCVIPGTELPPFRIGPAGRVQQQVGETWVDPEGDYYLPPPDARTNPSEIDRICLAAANAANALEQVYEDMIDAYNTDVDPAFGAIAYAGANGTVMLAALGFITGGLALVMYGVFTLFYEAFQWLTTDVWDDEFTNELVCILIDNATDTAGVVTFDYAGVMDAIARKVELEDALIDIRRFGQITYMMQFIGEQGLNLAGATTAITTPDCEDCEPDWCCYFDFTIDDGGWDVVVNASYVSGQGWRSAINTQPTAVYRGCNIELSLGGSYTITFFKADFTVLWGGLQGTPTTARNITLRLNSLAVNDPASVSYPAVNDTLLFEGSLDSVSKLLFLSTVGYDSVAPRVDQGGQIEIHNIEVRGKGTNPFPAYAC